MGGLAGVVREQLREVLEWPVLSFGSTLENGKSLGGGVDLAETVAGGRQREDADYSVTRE